MKTASISRASTFRAGLFKADIDKIDIAKVEKKIATGKDWLGKKSVASGLHDFLPATTVDGGVIAKLKESYMV